MTLKNTIEKYGSVTKLLHWTIFILFLLQFGLVYRREYFPKDSPEKLQYLLLHESVGVLVLVVALFMIVWRHTGVRPPLNNMSAPEKFLAKLTHVLLYATMLIMPLSGISMSLYAGYNVPFFSLFEIPSSLVQKNEALGHFFYTTHVWTSYAIIALVSLHTLAALFHHFVRQDNVLRRMLPFA